MLKRRFFQSKSKVLLLNSCQYCPEQLLMFLWPIKKIGIYWLLCLGLSCNTYMYSLMVLSPSNDPSSKFSIIWTPAAENLQSDDKTVICDSMQFSSPGLTSMLYSKNGKNKNKTSNSGFWSTTTKMKSSLFTFLQIADALTLLTRHMYRIDISTICHVTFTYVWADVHVRRWRDLTAGHDCNHSKFLTFYSRVCDDRTRLTETRSSPDANQRVPVLQLNQSMSTAHQSWIWI